MSKYVMLEIEGESGRIKGGREEVKRLKKKGGERERLREESRKRAREACSTSNLPLPPPVTLPLQMQLFYLQMSSSIFFSTQPSSLP